MMTGFACWLLYIASYGLVYVVLAFVVVYDCFNEIQKIDGYQSFSTAEKMGYILQEEKVALIILFLLILLSIAWTRHMKKWKNNTRIKHRMLVDSKVEEAAFMLPYIATILSFNLNAYGWIICILIFLSVGLIFVQSRNVQMSPIFILSRYHILTDGTIRVITKNSVEAYNLMLDDSPNGVEVRELTRGVFITL